MEKNYKKKSFFQVKKKTKTHTHTWSYCFQICRFIVPNTTHEMNTFVPFFLCFDRCCFSQRLSLSDQTSINSRSLSSSLQVHFKPFHCSSSIPYNNVTLHHTFYFLFF
jgi:hypothetical protein